MQRSLSEYARALPNLGLSMLLGWGVCLTSAALAQTYSFESDPFEMNSTLDEHVPQQNLLWQSTVKGFAAATTQAPRNSANASAPEKSTPLKIADQPAAKRASTPTPFSKWISPRSSGTRPRTIPSTDVTPTPRNSTEPQARDSETPNSKTNETALRDPNAMARRTAPNRRPPANPRQASPSGRRIGEVLDQERMPTPGDIAEEERNATPLEGYPEPKAAPKQEPVPTHPVQLPPLTKNQKALRDHVRRVLRYYYDRPMNTRDRSPWEVMHCALSFEVHSRMLQGGPQGKPVSAVGWLCYNQSCRRMNLMYVDEEGELNVRVGPALQGHRGQLLAILAQTNVSSEYPMLVDGHEMKIKDLIKAEMKTCYPRTELTFKLIGLMHYLDSEIQWVNDQGQEWNMRKLVTEELRQPIRGAACGGTHRLSGLTLAYKTRQARGEPVDGEYAQAYRFVAQHQLYTFRTQNPDGSFSTNWFQGREDEPDIDRKLKTTGHMLEWLLYSATDKELKDPRTTKAVRFLSNLMYQNRYRDWEAGPLGHAIHALFVYDRLMFSKYDSAGDMPMAIRDSDPKRGHATFR